MSIWKSRSGGTGAGNASHANRAAFPATGVADVLYLAKDTGQLYSWDATASDYVTVGGGTGGVSVLRPGTLVYLPTNVAPAGHIPASGQYVPVADWPAIADLFPVKPTVAGGGVGGSFGPGDGIVTASSYIDANRSPDKAFDGLNGDTGNCWHSVSESFSWLRYEFTSPRTVIEYRLAARPSGSYRPSNWSLQGSIDGVTWVTLDTRSDGAMSVDAANPSVYAVASPGAYTYYRIRSQAEATYTVLGEVVFVFQPVAGDNTVRLIPAVQPITYGTITLYPYIVGQELSGGGTGGVGGINATALEAELKKHFLL